MKQERTKDWVRLLLWAVLTINSQESSSTGSTPQELFHWERPAWLFKTPFPVDYKSPVRDWLEHRQGLPNLARANRKHVRERELTRRNHTRRPATFKVGDLVLVHHSRSPTVCRTPFWALPHYKDGWIQDPCEVQSRPKWRVALCT